MDKHRKLGFALIGFLLLGTIGARAAYRAGSRARTVPSGVDAHTDTVSPAPTAPPWHDFASGHSRGSVRVQAEVDRTAVMKDGDGVVHVGVTIDTRGLSGRRVPSDIIVVLDRSGSMEGQKLDYGKQALRQLIDRMGDEDRLGLVTYDDKAELRVALGENARSGRGSWQREVDSIVSGGSTNMAAGLDLGITQIDRAGDSGHSTRLLLLSDGLANTGDTSRTGLMARVHRVTRVDAVLSSVGVGADFDEGLMTTLARAGTGAFYYLAKLQMLPELLSAELKTAAQTYAHAGVVRFVASPGVVVTSASTGLVNQAGGAFEIPVGGVFGDQARTLWLTLKVPTDRLAEIDLGAVSFDYRRDGEAFRVEAEKLPRIACITDQHEFDRRIAQKVWEQAVLDEEINRSRESMSEAIRSGQAADVDRAVASTDADQKLAQRLGNARVVAEFNGLAKAGAEAKVAQQAAPAARSVAAKRSAAESFGKRNQGAYPNIDFASAY